MEPHGQPMGPLGPSLFSLPFVSAFALFYFYLPLSSSVFPSFSSAAAAAASLSSSFFRFFSSAAAAAASLSPAGGLRGDAVAVENDDRERARAAATDGGQLLRRHDALARVRRGLVQR